MIGVDRATAIELMNRYGVQKTPFLFIIDFEMKNSIVLPLQEIDTNDLLFAINQTNNISSLVQPNKKPTQDLFFQKYPIDFADYSQQFEQVIRHIKDGNTYLTNLTCPTLIKMNLTLKDVFWQSEAKYKLWCKDEFVVFSPEIFIQITDNQIFSFPMKGTIDAAIPNAEALILSDEKEKAEHATIVDLIRNDLSMVAEKVQVERFRYIEKIKTHDKTLLQVSSKIVGTLPLAYQIGDLIFKLLPAGSVSGAPKEKTMDIILEVENYKRGFYTGILGIFDGKKLDSGVMIRFIEQCPEGLIFKSGGGITYKSQPQSEYQEMIDKVYVPIIGNHQSSR